MQESDICKNCKAEIHQCRLGVGAKAPSAELESFGLKRKTTASNDKLFEQLLGKKAAKGHRASKARVQQSVADSKPVVVAPESEEEDEGGRASVLKTKGTGKRKRRPDSGEEEKHSTKNGNADQAPEEGGENVALRNGSDTEVLEVRAEDDGARSSRKARSGRRGMSYMDQLLEEKARKKKKKI